MCLDVAELHSTLETVRQRHRQRPGLCSWRHVCQSHLCGGQQGHCKHFKVFSLTIAAPHSVKWCASDFPLSLTLCLRQKIWLQKLNGRLRTAWSMWAGWTRRQKKQRKKRWGEKMFYVSSPGGFHTAAQGRHKHLKWALLCCCFCVLEWLRNTALPPGVKTHLLQFFFNFCSLQADAIYNMVGYPEFIMNATKLDKVFNDVGKWGTATCVWTAPSPHTSRFLKHRTETELFSPLLIPHFF